MMENQKKNRAVTSMILGILSIVSCCVPVLPLVLAVSAIIMGIASMTNSEGSRGMAITGVICGGVGVIMGLVASLGWIGWITVQM